MENNWVSVKDDLPEYTEKVLWFDKKRGMWVKKKGPQDYPLPETTTHWQRLPATPINITVKDKRFIL